ncbi:unnamed protein product, partial [Ixodes hexagonus]
CQILEKEQDCFQNRDEGWSYGIPAHPDLFVGFATPPGYYAWRDENEGSIFIQTLCKVFDKYALGTAKRDLVWLMTRVNSDVGREFESQHQDSRLHGKKQAPCFVSSLRKKLYFSS